MFGSQNPCGLAIRERTTPHLNGVYLSPIYSLRAGCVLQWYAKGGRYKYVDHLKALDSQRPQSTVSLPIISWEVHTPLILQEWAREQAGQPDQVFSQYILAGINNGFRIGFNRHCGLKSAGSNLHCDNPESTCTERCLSVECGGSQGVLNQEGFISAPWALFQKRTSPVSGA